MFNVSPKIIAYIQGAAGQEKLSMARSKVVADILYHICRNK